MGKLTTHVLDTDSGNPAQGVRIRLHRDGELLAETVTNGWMVALGMEISHAPDGTVRGILAGSNPAAAPLLLGSHLDTVIDAGKYDGVLGIIAALAALETLHQEKITLPFPVHLLAFSDEEGTRFQTTYLGSRSILAPLDPATLEAKDAAGINIAQAIAHEGWNADATTISATPPANAAAMSSSTSSRAACSKR